MAGRLWRDKLIANKNICVLVVENTSAATSPDGRPEQVSPRQLTESSFHQWVLETYPPTAPKSAAAKPPMWCMKKPAPPRLCIAQCKDEPEEMEEGMGQFGPDEPTPAPALKKHPQVQSARDLPRFAPLNQGKGWGQGHFPGHRVFPTPLTRPICPPSRQNPTAGWTPPAPPAHPIAPPMNAAPPAAVMGIFPLWGMGQEGLVGPLGLGQMGAVFPAYRQARCPQVAPMMPPGQPSGKPIERNSGNGDGRKKRPRGGGEETTWIQMDGKRIKARYCA